MDYHQRVMLLAYYKQEKYGVYSPEKDTNTGYFDLVGSDRRYVKCKQYCWGTIIVVRPLYHLNCSVCNLSSRLNFLE